MSNGFERFYSVAAICSVDATTNMHRKKKSTNRETLELIVIFQETEHCEPAAGAEKIRLSTVSVVVCIPESQKKRLRRYKKVLEKLHYIELLWLHFRIEIWQPPLTQDRPNIFTSACALIESPQLSDSYNLNGEIMPKLCQLFRRISTIIFL